MLYRLGCNVVNAYIILYFKRNFALYAEMQLTAARTGIFTNISLYP